MSDSHEVMAEGGVRAGQRLNLEFDAYFPPLPEAEGYGSAKLLVHWEANGRQGDAAPVRASGWWG